MFCEKCGKQLEENDQFCMYCGHEVSLLNMESEKAKINNQEPQQEERENGETTIISAGEQETRQPQMETKEEKKPSSSKGQKVVIGVLIAVITLLIGALTFFLVSGLSPSDLFGSNSKINYATNQTYEDSEEKNTESTTKTTTTESTTQVYDEAEADGVYYRVSVGYGNRLSFRALPDEDSTKLNRINNGTLLYITEVHGNWGKTTFEGESGWVCLRKDEDTYCVKE